MLQQTDTITALLKESAPQYSKPRKRDDELWKGILEDVFDDFLRFFFPNADELFGMKKKFEFLDKEFNRLFPPEEGTAGVRFVGLIFLSGDQFDFALQNWK